MFRPDNWTRIVSFVLWHLVVVVVVASSQASQASDNSLRNQTLSINYRNPDSATNGNEIESLQESLMTLQAKLRIRVNSIQSILDEMVKLYTDERSLKIVGKIDVLMRRLIQQVRNIDHETWADNSLSQNSSSIQEEDEEEFPKLAYKWVVVLLQHLFQINEEFKGLNIANKQVKEGTKNLTKIMTSMNGLANEFKIKVKKLIDQDERHEMKLDLTNLDLIPPNKNEWFLIRIVKGIAKKVPYVAFGTVVGIVAEKQQGVHDLVNRTYRKLRKSVDKAKHKVDKSIFKNEVALGRKKAPEEPHKPFWHSHLFLMLVLPLCLMFLLVVIFTAQYTHRIFLAAKQSYGTKQTANKKSPLLNRYIKFIKRKHKTKKKKHSKKRKHCHGTTKDNDSSNDSSNKSVVSIKPAASAKSTSVVVASSSPSGARPSSISNKKISTKIAGSSSSGLKPTESQKVPGSGASSSKISIKVIDNNNNNTTSAQKKSTKTSKTSKTKPKPAE